jgi:hypothetical protein
LQRQRVVRIELRQGTRVFARGDGLNHPPVARLQRAGTNPNPPEIRPVKRWSAPKWRRQRDANAEAPPVINAPSLRVVHRPVSRKTPICEPSANQTSVKPPSLLR